MYNTTQQKTQTEPDLVTQIARLAALLNDSKVSAAQKAKLIAAFAQDLANPNSPLSSMTKAAGNEMLGQLIRTLAASLQDAQRTAASGGNAPFNNARDVDFQTALSMGRGVAQFPAPTKPEWGTRANTEVLPPQNMAASQGQTELAKRQQQDQHWNEWERLWADFEVKKEFRHIVESPTRYDPRSDLANNDLKKTLIGIKDLLK